MIEAPGFYNSTLFFYFFAPSLCPNEGDFARNRRHFVERQFWWWPIDLVDDFIEPPPLCYDTEVVSANSTLWVMSVMAILVRIHSGVIKVAFLNACFSKSRWSMIKRRVRKQNISRSRALSAYSVKSPLR